MCFSKCILLILLIFHLSSFLSAQVLLNATVQVSTSWMINDLSFGNVSNVLSTRFILRKMIDEQVGFACGFVSKGDDKSFIFAIGIVRYYYSHTVDFEMVWFANRNKPVSENGTLHLLPDGNLVLRDADETFVWSTYTSMRSVIGMKLMETGNLVLYDSYNRTVWQSFDHPPNTLLNATVQVSTSWMINDLSFGNVSINDDALSTRFISTRFILRKMINRRVGFACGFVSKGDDKSFIFAIGIVQYQYSDIADLSVDSYEYLNGFEMVWFANRNKTVSENGTLHLLPDGNLILSDADGTFVWSTYTSMRSVTGMKLMETGNLVLYDSYNRTVWQSFDHPSDTLLDGQKLIAGQKLVARVSSTNWDEGDYYLSVTSQGLFAFYKQQLYFKFLIQGTRKAVETSYVKSVNGTLALYISSTETSEPDAVFSKPSNMSMMRMKLDNDGHFKVYSEDQTEPIDLLEDFLSACDYPTVCENYGLCSNDHCSCPAGYINSQSSNACSEISPVACNGRNSHKLVELTNVSHFSFVDPNAAILKGTDVESCKQACLRNCSCKAALFLYFYNVSHGNCFLPSPVLSLIDNGQGRSLYQSSAFIKVSDDQEKKSQSSLSVGQIVLIAGLSLGTCILVVIAICVFIMFLRKKRGIEEDEDDNFDQVSGMPLRFSYEELKLATENFAIKLGEGGFGSVFEGSLSNGERIAVKRLDGLGQGKKEFLAEVKTIGSIHHVNLVRLIGFCADKQQRLLVYEFMCNGSLDKWIFCRNMDQPTLNWQERRNIVLDIAKGLAYLHEECRQKIVHLDIKPQNILLDENQCAKVSDFGLSKFIDRDQSHTVTTMRGTPGYLAPEWLTSAITEKADVYSYGIVVMEIICGRKNLDRAQPEECMHLLRLFMKQAQENKLIDLIDKNSEDMQMHRPEAMEMMRLAAWCLQHEFTRRPSMSVVVKVIEGAMDIEADLNYSFSNQPTVAAVRGDSELRDTATLLPSVLSGPR